MTQPMPSRTNWSLCVCALLLAVAARAGTVQPAPVFTDNMVLQRDKPVPVWGKAAAGERVTVEFAGQEKTAVADEAGSWRAVLDALAADREGRTLTLRGGDGQAVALTNVVVGEVWLCSGQSNMEWTVAAIRGLRGAPEDSSQPLIRQLRVPRLDRAFPVDKFDARWIACTPETVGGFTAAGYFFALELLRELDVPVGLLNASAGGTRLEPWASAESLRDAADLPELAARLRRASPLTEEGRASHEAYFRNLEAWVSLAREAVAGRRPLPPPPEEPWIVGNEQQPTRLFNGMIAPLVPFALRGVLWYQGEANTGDPPGYAAKMAALVGGWRQAWSDPAMPFYYVQLAAFQASDPAKPAMGDGWARLREEQSKALSLFEATGMAVTIDIGDAVDIHPTNKQDVGRRLARWALARTYGAGGVPCGPLYRTHRSAKGAVVIEFDHADSGLFIGRKEGTDRPVVEKDGPLPWLSVAGPDRVFHWAQAQIDGPRLVVSSPDVPEPVAVRYAFTQNPTGPKLYNKEGLPAAPFRTDDW